MSTVRRINGALHISLHYPMTGEEYAFARRAARQGGYSGVGDYLVGLLTPAFYEDYAEYLKSRDPGGEEDRQKPHPVRDEDIPL